MTTEGSGRKPQRMDKKKLTRGPITWLLFIILLAWIAMTFLTGPAFQRIDTSDGLKLLEKGKTVTEVEVTEGAQRVRMKLTKEFTTEDAQG